MSSALIKRVDCPECGATNSTTNDIAIGKTLIFVTMNESIQLSIARRVHGAGRSAKLASA